MKTTTPRFHAMLDAVVDGWFALDADWRIVEVSPASAVRFGRPVEALERLLAQIAGTVAP